MLGDFNRLNIWSVDRGDGGGRIKATRLEPAERLPDDFTTLALCSEGSLLALGDRSGNVTLLDTGRLSVVGRIPAAGQETQGMLFAVAFSPDGRRLAVGTAQGQILLWDVANPARPRLALRLPGQRGMVTTLAFDTRGQRLASSSGAMDPVVEIWNLDLLNRELASLGIPVRP
jgi:WD40 repeat protein